MLVSRLSESMAIDEVPRLLGAYAWHASCYREEVGCTVLPAQKARMMCMHEQNYKVDIQNL
jgi:hypothetical protein